MIRQSSQLTKLPLEIISNILTRIPILLIARLKYVCHAWLELFESPEFSKLHLSKSSAGLLVYQHLGGSYLIKIFRFEDELVVECHQFNYTPVRRFDLTEFKCNTISGSVDGFLCFLHVGHIDNLYICHPITREYISLPTLESYVQFPSMVTCSRSECHVYSLGTTGTWRSIAPGPPLHSNCYSIGAFLNGNLHWLVGDLKDSYVISCLDLDKEMFRTFSGPPLPGYRTCKCLGGLVVLGDCLSVCNNMSEHDIVIWIMKDYGVGKSWSKEFVISKLPSLAGECYELVLPIKVFRNGDISML
ncbi:F-box protein At3g07870-like [Primulina huaijiensis]|uniref:F-box protein At3g07870-like n=1 Tax=Primulina huaijiensis TaxID=1492673 RepID=UPI003CC76C2F